jgi:hypothetical protein
MSSKLESIDWSVELDLNNIDLAYDRFCLIYNRLCDEFIPKFKPSPNKARPPWVSRELIQLDNKRKRLFHSNVRSHWKSASKVRTYRRTIKELASRSSAAIVSFERRLAFDKNPKSLFSYVRQRNAIDTSITALKSPTDRTVTEPKEIADVLNNHFSSVFQGETDNLPCFSSPLVSFRLESVMFTEADIAERLAALDRTKSMGVDGIHPHVLRECSHALAQPLVLIISSSIRSASLPLAWRRANVTPIHKKGRSRHSSHE